MIKETKDINYIAKIWCEAFGDSFEDVKFFDDKLKNGRCIGYFENNVLVSMLYLVDCKLNDVDSHYIYAACTLEEHKKNGYMTEIIKYCIDKYSSVCLIPANVPLIDYYKKRGIIVEYDLSKISFLECEELKENYLFEGCELQTPIILSNK